MIDKIKISFGALIAHFIPGFVVMLTLLWVYRENKLFSANLDMKTLSFSVLFIIISLTVGLVIDATRYLVMQCPRFCKNYRAWINYDTSKATEDDRKYYDWVIENHFRFHQFYGNLSIALLISYIFLFKCCENPHWLIMVILICATASGFTFYRTIDDLKKKFPNTLEGE